MKGIFLSAFGAGNLFSVRALLAQPSPPPQGSHLNDSEKTSELKRTRRSFASPAWALTISKPDLDSIPTNFPPCRVTVLLHIFWPQNYPVTYLRCPSKNPRAG